MLITKEEYDTIWKSYIQRGEIDVEIPKVYCGNCKFYCPKLNYIFLRKYHLSTSYDFDKKVNLYHITSLYPMGMSWKFIEFKEKYIKWLCKIGAFCDCEKKNFSYKWNANTTFDFFKQLLYFEDMKKLKLYEVMSISDKKDVLNDEYDEYDTSKKFKNILNKHLRFVKEYKSLLLEEEDKLYKHIELVELTE